jgi:hypothetical protein
MRRFNPIEQADPETVNFLGTRYIALSNFVWRGIGRKMDAQANDRSRLAHG